MLTGHFQVSDPERGTVLALASTCHENAKDQSTSLWEKNLSEGEEIHRWEKLHELSLWTLDLHWVVR